MDKRFGKYEILGELGKGAFGRVYRAFDPNVKRYVAIKVLASQTDPELLIRFEAEAGAAGKLAHKNIVTVYEFGREGDTPYLVMELLSGKTLQDVISMRKDLSLLDKLEILYQVGEGLQAAHSNGVIHRDMKPGNIMVLPDGSAKIMDFGIALVAAKDAARNTRQGDMLGTVLYMAPEQFQGIEADARTDLFAYGVVCYEFLTGQHPFAAADPRTIPVRIASSEPPPLREVIPECSDVLESVIQRLMSKDRDFRVAKAEEALLDIAPVLVELRQRQAEVLAAQIQPLVESDNLGAAQVHIDAVLRLDSLNATARRWQAELRRRRNQAAVKARVDACLEKANELYADRRFSEAIPALEDALRLDRDNPSILSLLEKSRSALTRSRQAGQLIAEARWDERDEAFEVAIEKVARAVELDPENRTAIAYLENLKLGVIERAAKAAFKRAERHWASEQFEPALSALAEIPPDLAISAKASALRTCIQADMAEAARLKRLALFQAALAGGRQELMDGRLPEAMSAAEALAVDFPDQPQAVEFLTEVREIVAARRRAQEIAQIAETAEALRQEKRFTDATSALEAGLRTHPDASQLRDTLEEIRVEHAAYDRFQAVEKALRVSQLFQQAGQFDDAIRVVAETLAVYPGDAVLEELKSSLEVERERGQYAAGLEDALRDAQRLLADGESAAAITLLENAIYLYPGEPPLRALLTSARRMAASQRQQALTDAALLNAAKSEESEDLSAALRWLEAAMSDVGPRAELAAAAERIRQKIQELDRLRAISDAAREISQAVASNNWDLAESVMNSAQERFPAALPFDEFAAEIRTGRFTAALQTMETAVRRDLDGGDLLAAEQRLSSARAEFGEQPVWHELWTALTERKAHEAALESARRALDQGNVTQAEELLNPAIGEQPDPRETQLLAGIAQLRQQREAAAQARREAEERDRQALRDAITAARQQASAQLASGDTAGAVALLDRFCRQYPHSPELAGDRLDAVTRLEQEQEEAARRGAEEQRIREAAERARQEREDRRRRILRKRAIATGRRAARVLGRDGKLVARNELLERLCEEYPDSAELAGDRKAAVDELAALIGAARQQARVLLDANNLAEAMVLLDRLCSEYPDSIGLKADRALVMRAMEDAIASGRRCAAGLLENGRFEDAVAEMRRLCDAYPHNEELENDRAAAINALNRHRLEREAAERALERQRQEEHERLMRAAEEQARREQRQAEIAAQRRSAADLIHAGDLETALARLEQLSALYPHAREILDDRDRVASQLEERRRQERIRRESEERIRLEREGAISAARADAQVLVRKGDYRAAIAVLSLLATRFPGDAEIESVREDLVQEWDRHQKAEQARRDEERRRQAEQERKRAEDLARQQQQEAEQAARLVRERQAEEEARRRADQQAIDEARANAAALSAQSDFQGAAAILDGLAARYPGNSEIQHDRETLAGQVEERRIRAEERANRALESFSAGKRTRAERQLERAISKELAGAEELVRKGDFAAATSILDRLALLHPEHAGIQRQREATARDFEQWRAKSIQQAADNAEQRPLPEERARQALAAFSARRNVPEGPPDSPPHDEDWLESVVDKLRGVFGRERR